MSESLVFEVIPYRGGDLEAAGTGFVDLSEVPFTNRRDLVDRGLPLVLQAGRMADSLQGSDGLTGASRSTQSRFTVSTATLDVRRISGLRLNAGSSLLAGSGRDGITGVANMAGLGGDYRIGYGIYAALGASFSAEEGNDRIIGRALAPRSDSAHWLAGVIIQEGSGAQLGAGQDSLKGIAWGAVSEAGGVAGLALLDELAPGEMASALHAGSGNDLIEGVAHVTTVVDADGTTQAPEGVEHGVHGIGALGAPLPPVEGTAGAIYMEAGHDRVVARASIGGGRVDGFGDGVLVDLGAGNDVLVGFGSMVDGGGRGRDVWDLSDYNVGDFKIKLVSERSQSAQFLRAETATLSRSRAFVRGFETFRLRHAVLAFSDLPFS